MICGVVILPRRITDEIGSCFAESYRAFRPRESSRDAGFCEGSRLRYSNGLSAS